MTRVSIPVQVPRPCAAAWEAMPPVAQGRYCAACQHTVTDFMHRTDAEILAALSQAVGQRVCGRFRAEQLCRELVHAPAAAPRWQAWLLAVASLWGLPSLIPPAAHAQQLPPHATATLALVPSNAGSEVPATGAAAAATERIRGVVRDARTGEPIPGAHIVLVGTTRATTTAADGTFELEAPAAGWQIEVSFAGYGTRTVHRLRRGRALRIRLKADTFVLGEIAWLAPPAAPPSPGWRHRLLTWLRPVQATSAPLSDSLSCS